MDRIAGGENRLSAAGFLRPASPVSSRAFPTCGRVASVNENSAVSALAGLRLAVGVSSWTTPRMAGKLFGLDAGENPQSPYLARLFGVRDIALAWGTMSAEGGARRQWLIAGLACDAADALAGVAGGGGGYLSKRTAVLVTATALSAVALGAAALAAPSTAEADGSTAGF
jgi:hypothetical protein